jgi:endonuclease III
MKQQKAAGIRRVLNQLYPDPPIPLNHRDTFTFLLAVVLSAQTTDGKVNDVTKALFQNAPTPEILSKLSVVEVLTMIGPVGLSFKKARYLVDLSKKIIQDFEGKVPRTYEGLESLPGVGHKTASVIMSQVMPHVLIFVTLRGLWRASPGCGHPRPSPRQQMGSVKRIQCRQSSERSLLNIPYE